MNTPKQGGEVWHIQHHRRGRLLIRLSHDITEATDTVYAELIAGTPQYLSKGAIPELPGEPISFKLALVEWLEKHEPPFSRRGLLGITSEPDAQDLENAKRERGSPIPTERHHVCSLCEEWIPFPGETFIHRDPRPEVTSLALCPDCERRLHP